MIKIFLCYAHEDIDVANTFYDKLAIEGLNPWMDKKNLKTGDKWEKVIPQTIKESDYVMVFLSHNSVSKRGYIQKEFKFVLDELEKIPEGIVYVLPIKVDNCEIPTIFSEYQWTHINDENSFNRIVESIRTHSKVLSEKPSALRSASIGLDDQINAALKSVEGIKDHFLNISIDIKYKYKDLINSEQSGVFKLLNQETYKGIIAIPNSGSCYSFSCQKHDAWNEADIMLSRQSFKGSCEAKLSLSFKGLDYGFFFDISDIDFFQNTSLLSTYDSLDSKKLVAWNFIWNYNPPTEVSEIRLEGRKYQFGVKKGSIIIKSSQEVFESCVYIGRVINYEYMNALVVFKIAEIHNKTVTIAYKTIKTYNKITPYGREPTQASLSKMFNDWRRLQTSKES